MSATTESKESHLTKAAWGELAKGTITNCFQHAGFKIKEEYEKK